MNCRECEQQLVEALYGELGHDEMAEFERHIEACSGCAQVYSELRATLTVMDGRERPDPGQAYWDGYHNRLTARMEREEQSRRSRGWLGRLLPGLSDAGLRWAYRGALAVALIVFGAVAGRLVLPGPDTSDIAVVTEPDSLKGGKGQPGEPPAAVAASTEECARQYIEDSKVLLLALVNFDMETEAEYLGDWTPQKKRSSELLVQAASLKNDLDDPKQRRLRDLVTELELILIQIANLETTGDLEAVDLIRGTVSEQDVLLKINLEEMRGGVRETPKPGVCDA
jgi:hypothetical protein